MDISLWDLEMNLNCIDTAFAAQCRWSLMLILMGIHRALTPLSIDFLPDEEKNKQNKTKAQTSEPSEGKAKTVRHAYVHKPYLYSKYYSDSDDELTVEQRRQSIVSLVDCCLSCLIADGLD